MGNSKDGNRCRTLCEGKRDGERIIEQRGRMMKAKRTGREWISVEERLPEQDSGCSRSGPVLVFDKYSEAIRVDHCLYIEGEEVGFTTDISHWMELPNDPVIKGEMK